MRNIQEQVKKRFYYKNCLTFHFLNKLFSMNPKQLFLTVGQDNFGKKIPLRMYFSFFCITEQFSIFMTLFLQLNYIHDPKNWGVGTDFCQARPIFHIWQITTIRFQIGKKYWDLETYKERIEIIFSYLNYWSDTKAKGQFIL